MSSVIINDDSLDFEDELNLVINSFSKDTLPNNPNTTFGDVFGPAERRVGALLSSPEMLERYKNLYGDEEINTQIDNFNQVKKQRLNFYNREPFQYTDEERFPQYVEDLDYYSRNADRQIIANPAYRSNPPIGAFTGEGYPTKPNPPMGYEKSKRIASYGFNPFDELPIGNIFRGAVAFGAPRNPTAADLNYALENFGGGQYKSKFPGIFKQINPSQPREGIVYSEEGKEDVIYDSPTVGARDIGEYTLQEAPTLAAEFYLGSKGLKGFGDEFLRDVPKDKGIFGKIGDSFAFNAMLGGGAALTNFTQRLVGLGMGVHNRTPTEMAQESGLIGLLAFGGNQTIDLFLNGFPKLYRAVTGKDASAASIKDFEQAIRNKQESYQGIKKPVAASKRTGVESEAVEEITLQDIDEVLKELGDEIGEELKYNPTLAQASKDTVLNEIERLVLTRGDKYSKELADIINGNEVLITKLFENIFGNLKDDVTGQSAAATLTNLFGRNQEQFVEEGFDIINSLKLNIDELDTIAKETGKDNVVPASGKEVLDERTANSLYQRTASKLQAAKTVYKEQIDKPVNDLLDSDQFKNITISPRKIKPVIQKFKQLSEGNSPGLSQTGQQTIKKIFRDTFSTEQFARLTKYSEGDITLRELNSLRIDMNLIRSGLQGSVKAGDRKSLEVVSNLQDAIEEQIALSIRKIADSPKQARDFIDLFDAQRNQYQLLSNTLLRDLSTSSPDEVLNILLRSGTKKGPLKQSTNTQAREFVEFLETSFDDVNFLPILDDLRSGLARQISETFLQREGTDQTALQLGKNFKKFVEDNEITLKTIFGDELFKKGFPQSPKKFIEDVITPLQRNSDQLKLLERTFGSGNPFNIVRQIFESNRTTKASGELADSIKVIEDLIARQATEPEKELLQRQFKQATKKYLVQRLTTADGSFDIRLLDDILKDFAPEQMVGRDSVLTFESVYGKFLGDESADFVRRLKVLRDISTRQNMPTTAQAEQIRNTIEQEITDTQTSYLRRFLIPPLTQFGRQTTAADRLIGQRNLKYTTRLLLDENLFKSFVDAIKDRKKMNVFIKALNTHQTITASDIANTLEGYNKEERRAQTLEERINNSPQGDFLPILDEEKIFENIIGGLQ